MEYIKNRTYLQMISDILNDDTYKSWLKLIEMQGYDFANSSETNSQIALDHGLCHTTSVAENTAKLLYQSGCEEKIIFLGYVAGLLHDIGIVNGKSNHAKSSFELAKEYLNKFDILNSDDKDLILNAIYYHRDGANIISPIDIFITISDKLDFTKARRIKSRYESKSKIDEIISNDFNIKEDKLIIDFKVSNDFDNSAFYSIPKSIDIPIEIGTKAGLDVQFYINGKLENFEDRVDYIGYVYGK